MAVSTDDSMQEYFTSLLVAVAPEKGQQVRELIRGRRIKFEVDDSSDRVLFAARGGDSPMGYILHHELAHIIRDHEYDEGFISIVQEKEADWDAAAWLLDSPDISLSDRLKRTLGVCVGLGWLASSNVYLRHSGDTHPPGYDRLYQTLEQFEDDDDSVAWAFVMTLLRLHLSARNAVVTFDGEFPSFKAAANHYIDVISRIESVQIP